MSNKLEILLRRAGRELADYQVARFFKVPEELAQTPCDFFGYTVIGRAILIEAKMVERPSLPIGNDPGLQPHQWNELADANRAGALSLVCWARGGICATLSFDLAAKLAEDRRSIPWEKIEKKYLRPMSGSLCHLALLDHWLPIRGS
jgi:hypothetical protein